MSTAPETQVLSQALEKAVGDGRVRVAVFVTFQLDPAFFEHAVLPILFRRGFSDNEAVRRVQLEEALREVDHLAVYYDRSGLITESGAARLDVRRIGVSMSTGVLHAKHVLLLVEDPGEPPMRRCVMLTTSANLTRSGWWENVEVGHVHQIDEGSKDLVREDLLGRDGLLATLERLDAAAHGDRQGRDAPHAGLHALRAFLKGSTHARRQAKQGGRFHPRLWHGERPLPEFLGEYARAGCRLEIISPFFSDLEEAPTLRALIEALEPTAVRVLLPRGDDGTAKCSQAFYEAVQALPNVKWGKLPRRFTAFRKGEAASKQRYVHAKVYRVFSPSERTELMLVGSPNLTDAAHRGARRGNLESAMLLDLKPRGQPDWWLEADMDVPVGFQRNQPEDEPLDAVLPVTLAFDWKSGALRYFWEKRRAGNPETFAVSSGGEPLARVEPVALDAWAAIDMSAQVLRERLRSGAFLEVRVGDGPRQRVLVQETGMEHKPALVLELTPEQILEYWSMLTTEQQDAFLEREIARLVAREEREGTESGPAREDPTSLFDRFAGIFHAFSCLRERIDEALGRGDASGERYAAYRLFGVRYDSLRALVDTVFEAKEGDVVNRYVSLLCAREVVGWVRTKHAKFAKAHDDELEGLDAQLAAIDGLREAFAFRNASERAAFFEWFDEMFLRPVRVPKVKA